MPIVEIRCPRCGSPSSLKDEKTLEYYCDHCGTTFRFVDTTKRELVRDIRRHNCPICGRPVQIDEGHVCKECGIEDLCENCVDEVGRKIICKECIKKEENDCVICGKFATCKCAVCGRRACYKHAVAFDLEGNYWSKSCNYFSLSCPTCDHDVCMYCCVEKSSFLGGKAYYCKKCGTRLKGEPPKMNRHLSI